MPTLRKHSTSSRLADLEARTRTLENHLEATLRMLTDLARGLDHNVTRTQEETK